jgi:hypothetical protein
VNLEYTWEISHFEMDIYEKHYLIRFLSHQHDKQDEMLGYKAIFKDSFDYRVACSEG